MEVKISLAGVIFAFLIAHALTQATPIYADSDQFYSGIATCNLNIASFFTVTAPFTILTTDYRQPFYTAPLTTNNAILQSQGRLVYNIQLYQLTSTSFTVSVDFYYFTNGQVQRKIGFRETSQIGFRYLLVKSTFPLIYLSGSLELKPTSKPIEAGTVHKTLFDIDSITDPVSLSSTDTVFIHSLVNFHLVSSDPTSTKRFQLTITFVVVDQSSFSVQLKPKYRMALSSTESSHVTFFIYNKRDFDSVYVKMNYQVISFANLPMGSSSSVAKTYTAPFIPISTDQIVFGMNGLELNGYTSFGFQFSISSDPIGLIYTITLKNRMSISAIARLDLMLLLPSQFKCPNNQTYVDTSASICYKACPNGFYASSATVGITGINICYKCAATCKTCYGGPKLCTSCSSSQNRILIDSNCQPMSGFYQSNTDIALPCDAGCTLCANSSTNCTSCNQGYLQTGNLCVFYGSPAIQCLESSSTLCPTNHSIYFVFVLDFVFEKFDSANYNSFIDQVLFLAALPAEWSRQLKIKYLRVHNKLKGSVYINGTIFYLNERALSTSKSQFMALGENPSSIGSFGVQSMGFVQSSQGANEKFFGTNKIMEPEAGDIASSSSSSNLGIIIGVSAGGGGALLIATGVMVYVCWRRKQKLKKEQEEWGKESKSDTAQINNNLEGIRSAQVLRMPGQQNEGEDQGERLRFD